MNADIGVVAMAPTRVDLDNRNALGKMRRRVRGWTMRVPCFLSALGVVVLCLSLWLLPQAARAQSAAAQLPAEAAGETFTNARIVVVSVGALAGIIVANTLTDGLVMPVLSVTQAGAAPALAALRGTAAAGVSYAGLAGQEAAEALAHAAQARYYLVEASRVALTFAGAVGGGYVGYWLDGGH